MAHGDYNCCAICDSKMDFSYDAKTKESICIDCLKGLRNHGVNVLDSKELIDWMDKEDPKKVRVTMESIGFHSCFYANDVDAKYQFILATNGWK